MTTTDVLNVSGLMLALIAAFIALWQGYLLRKQLAQSQRTNEVDVYFRVAVICRDLDEFFVDRPELRPYFYENKKLPRSKRERDRLDATSEMLIDLAESIIASAPGLGSMAVDWHKYFAFLYRNSEALRQHWAKHSYYYPDSVREAFQAPVQSSAPPYMADHRMR